VNDAVDRVIIEREAMDQGFPGSLILSIGGHLFIVAGVVAVSLLVPPEPPLRVLDGFAVVMPRGGGGVPVTAPPAPAPAVQPPEPPASQPAPAPPEPKILKPPKDEHRHATLPDPETKYHKPKVDKTPPPRTGSARTSGGAPSGASARTPGLEFAPAGPGVPMGTETGGDWYLATVQQKIWMVWTQQIKADFTQPIGVLFTILADGSVDDVHVDQPSSAALLNLAAQRAIVSAAPFGPLPKDYGTNRYPIHVVFKPTP
jgi:TonB family protein